MEPKINPKGSKGSQKGAQKVKHAGKGHAKNEGDKRSKKDPWPAECAWPPLDLF